MTPIATSTVAKKSVIALEKLNLFTPHIGPASVSFAGVGRQWDDAQVGFDMESADKGVLEWDDVIDALLHACERGDGTAELPVRAAGSPVSRRYACSALLTVHITPPNRTVLRWLALARWGEKRPIAVAITQ